MSHPQIAAGAFLARFGVPPGISPVPLRPFQFSSLAHLDQRVAAVLTRARDVEGLRTATIRWMQDGYDSLRRFVIEQNVDRQLIGGDFVQQREVLTLWTGWLIQKGVARVTIRTYWRAMASVCSRIETDDGVLNLFRYVPAPRAGKVLPKSLTRENARDVLLFVRNYEWSSEFERIRNTAIISTMMLAGLRRLEVARLKREDVHERDGVLDIRAAKGVYGGKDRTAYMAPQLVADIEAYAAVRAAHKPATPSFFVALHRDEGIGGGALKRITRIISTNVGFRVSCHRLRHTYATLLRQSGIADRVSMDLLGHEQLATLQRYSRVFEPEYRQEVQKLAIDLS